MAFVIAAHFWRDAGDVVSPARQNFAYNRISADHIQSLRP
jgi:hypothetical protein